ncbi:transporter substrate-binding domain-containing protein [Pseudomonas lalucatii]|uniref:Transporter substrate-binding domain-containing protein n=1 Tax=Pseudomonas lalucatii TaxID=1424203 RepID=A0ABS5PYU5_9PSED|nr:transporter substrate-binding domain-containing protein [Pseudomonas lalucatii]MBS7661539.1 transporter substrate-binding domain-containing protein [Pseudomonas lalucatii]MBS7691859.1 transporter substrate-binding domain-containing protein [Pseudomonas lalucatii]
MRVVVLLLSLLLGTGVVAAQPLRLTSGEWPPFHGTELPQQGVASQIVTEAFALEGIEVQWEFLPWARAMQLASQGRRAGTGLWRRNAERERLFYISDPVLETQTHLFHRKSVELTWQTLLDLQGLRIGATRGYYYGEAFERAELSGQLNVQRIISDEVALRQLLAGRIDLFPLARTVASSLLAQRFTSAERLQLSFHPRPLSSHSLHLLLSRRIAANAELMARFNNGLARLHESGKVAQWLLDAQQPLGLTP